MIFLKKIFGKILIKIHNSEPKYRSLVCYNFPFFFEIFANFQLFSAISPKFPTFILTIFLHKSSQNFVKFEFE